MERQAEMVGVLRHLARPVWQGAGRLTTLLLPDDFLAVVDPLWSARWPAGRVEVVRAETADATTLVVRAGRGDAPYRRRGPPAGWRSATGWGRT